MLYSKTTKGFYDPKIHGSSIPADAVEITIEEHAALLDGQRQGKRITADADGRPRLQDPPPPTTEQLVVSEIIALESEITPRRQREAILGIDNGWLANQDAAIANLRKNIAK